MFLSMFLNVSYQMLCYIISSYIVTRKSVVVSIAYYIKKKLRKILIVVFKYIYIYCVICYIKF